MQLLIFSQYDSAMFLNLASIYLFKVNNGNNRTMGEICSKLTIKAPERRQPRRSSVFTVNFEQILHILLVFPLPI